MASAHRSRRKTQLPKRRKQTASKKTQRRKLLPQPKKPQLKQRKHPVPPPKPNLKRSSDEFVSKVLRQLNRDKVRISTKAKGKMITFIKRFYNNISEQAKRSKKFQRSSTIGSKELQNALKRVMRKKDALELVRTIRKVSGHRRH